MAKKTSTKKTSTKKTASKKVNAPVKNPRGKRRPAPADSAGSPSLTPTSPAAAQTRITAATGQTTKMTCLDAAHAVLARLNRPMRVRELVEQMADRDLWQSQAGATPESTVTAAIIREMKKRGGESRFQRVDRGFYAASSWQSP